MNTEIIQNTLDLDCAIYPLSKGGREPTQGVRE